MLDVSLGPILKIVLSVPHSAMSQWKAARTTGSTLPARAGPHSDTGLVGHESLGTLNWVIECLVRTSHALLEVTDEARHSDEHALTSMK